MLEIMLGVRACLEVSMVILLMGGQVMSLGYYGFKTILSFSLVLSKYFYP
jgi:hypothetical protein